MNFRLMVLIGGGFVFGYVMTADGGNSLFLAIFRQWLPVIFLSLFFVFLLLNLRKQRKMVQLLARGSALLSQGRVAQAHAVYEEAHALTPKSPNPKLSLGYSNLYLWRLDQASVQFDAGTTGMVGKSLRAIAVPSLSLVAALMHDRVRADSLEKESKELDLSESPQVNLARAVWAARTNQWQQVRDALPFQRIRPLAGMERALADALNAWAMRESQQPMPPVDLVGVLGETGPDAVRRYWPEFADFLESTAKSTA